MPTNLTREQAKAWGAQKAAQAKKIDPVELRNEPLCRPTITVQDWCELWLEDRRQRGLTSVPADASRLKTWVYPFLVGRRMGSLTRDDIERLVRALDRRIASGSIRWKTAKNVWGLVTKMFDDARSSKNRGLRVREDDPTDHVRGPNGGATRAKAYLYPSEFMKLVSCEQVPLVWRRLVTLAVYLYARAGELRALEWTDIDMEHEVVLIHQAADRFTRESRATKTHRTHRLPIEPHLKPLLKRLHDERGEKKKPLASMPHESKLATELRRYLKIAGVTRADLFVNDETRRHLTFHDLRATGIIWMAVRGDAPQAIQARVGHADYTMTQVYVREAEVVGRDFGEPFPRLPASLFGPGIGPGDETVTENSRTIVAEAHGNRTHRPPREGRAHPF